MNVDVYPVGVLSDLKKTLATLRHRGIREAIRTLRYGRRTWNRRSAWNGYLAEAEGAPHCGHGWTKKRALRSLEHIRATTHWATHWPCGTVRLSADVRRQYCIACGTSSPKREWARMGGVA